MFFMTFERALRAACLLLGGAVVHSAYAEQPIAHVAVENPSTYARKDEAVHLRLIDLGLPLDGDAVEELFAYEGQVPVPIQSWDRDGDGVAETATLVLDLAPAGRKEVRVVQDAKAVDAAVLPRRTYAEISRKFGGEWNGRVYEGGAFHNVQSLSTPPEHTDHSFFIRYEGPGWESEHVGYRFYLDWRNGFDIFGKRTRSLVLKDVGQDGFDSYHEPADWGMDVLKVGDSLGSGGYGLWVEGKVERVSETDGLRVEILENGPALSQFETLYRGWQGTDQSKTDLRADVSIFAGSRLSWVRLRPEEETAHPLCAGLVKAPGTDVIWGDLDVTGEAFTYLASWGPQSLDGTDLGMAILVRKKDLDEFTEDELNNVVVFKNSLAGTEYAFLAAWSQEPDGIDSKDAFVAYLDETVERLTIAPRTSVRSTLGEAAKAGPLTSEKALYWTKRMADSILKRRGETLAYGQFDPEAGRMARWTYTTGLIAKAVYDLAQPTGVQAYADWATSVISSFVEPDGTIRTYDISDFNIDKINSGKMLLQMHAQTGEERYRLATDLLRQQLRDHPRTKNGAFWHKKIYPWQVWLDGVYMGVPFLVGHEVAYSAAPDLREAIHEFLVVEEKLRDPETGLYWHAWDESKEQDWADPETGRSAYFWGRGLGWYAMAIVDTMDYLPKDSPEFAEMQRLLKDLAEAVVAVQDPELGVWYQILDRPQAPGNYPESSASSMFTYMLAKGVNRGWLDESYRAPAKKAFSGMLDEFVRVHADGTATLDHICRVAGLGFGRDGSYMYYMSEPVVQNDPKGIGPFLMAGYQVSKMLDE